MLIVTVFDSPCFKLAEGTLGEFDYRALLEPAAGREDARALAAHLAGSRYVLDSDETALGRHPDSDIFLDDITVSRRHAAVRRVGDGHYEVSDVGSLNGTYVDHHRVDTAPLHHLADLQIGRFVLVFLLGSGDS